MYRPQALEAGLVFAAISVQPNSSTQTTERLASAKLLQYPELHQMIQSQRSPVAVQHRATEDLSSRP
jgi:hypothetical protein